MRQFDYAQAGAYFVTLCTRDRRCMFGKVVNGRMELSDFGSVADATWADIPRHFPHVQVPIWVVMPNHVHGILVITQAPPGVTDDPFANQRPTGPTRGSIGAIVGAYKSAVSKQINRLTHSTGTPVWQRNYFEHVIRNDSSFAKIWQYIADKPARWRDDPEPRQRKGDACVAPTAGCVEVAPAACTTPCPVGATHASPRVCQAARAARVLPCYDSVRRRGNGRACSPDGETGKHRGLERLERPCGNVRDDRGQTRGNLSRRLFRAGGNPEPSRRSPLTKRAAGRCRDLTAPA